MICRGHVWYLGVVTGLDDHPPDNNILDLGNHQNDSDHSDLENDEVPDLPLRYRGRMPRLQLPKGTGTPTFSSSATPKLTK